MKKTGNNSGYFNDGKFAQELRGQPRKSAIDSHKHTSHHGNSSDEDEAGRHHAHRSEPAKNAVRVQLRRIQRLF